MRPKREAICGGNWGVNDQIWRADQRGGCFLSIDLITWCSTSSPLEWYRYTSGLIKQWFITTLYNWQYPYWYHPEIPIQSHEEGVFDYYRTILHLGQFGTKVFCIKLEFCQDILWYPLVSKCEIWRQSRTTSISFQIHGPSPLLRCQNIG